MVSKDRIKKARMYDRTKAKDTAVRFTASQLGEKYQFGTSSYMINENRFQMDWSKMWEEYYTIQVLKMK
jgi:hypothetical protein